MKRIKVLACVISVAMLGGLFAGCSKATTIDAEKFAKACEKLKLDETDVDASLDMDDYEEGCYTYISEDDIEDYEYEVLSFLDNLSLDDVIDADDVRSIAVAVKCDGLSDLGDIDDLDELADLVIDGAVAFNVELDDNYVEDVMEYVEDTFAELDLSTKNLTGKELFSSDKAGYARIHIDVAQLAKILHENDDFTDFIDDNEDSIGYDLDEISDLLQSIKGDVAVSVEVTEKNIFVIAGGALNTKTSVLNSFCSALGAAVNPVSVPMNKKFVEELVDNAFDLISQYSRYF